MCFFAQPWNVRPANVGIAASRWMPMTFSIAIRSGRLRSDQFASGATGVPARPAHVGRAEDAVAQRHAVALLHARRACELISAMCTPCGQTCVQMPQPEQ